MPQDKLNELRRLVSEIDLLKSEINQRLDTLERKQRELERMLCKLEGNSDLSADDAVNTAAVNADNIESAQSQKRSEPSESSEHKADDFDKTSHKLDGKARKGKMSSLLEKYSD